MGECRQSARALLAGASAGTGHDQAEHGQDHQHLIRRADAAAGGEDRGGDLFGAAEAPQRRGAGETLAAVLSTFILLGIYVVVAAAAGASEGIRRKNAMR